MRLLLLMGVFLSGALPCPAPLIFTPGEGWVYEPVGSEEAWKRGRAREQIAVAQEAYDQANYSLAIKAARRTVNAWPLSDYAPQAQELLAQSYQAKGKSERAFEEYQILVSRYPMRVDYERVASQQCDIVDEYLAGRWFKLWGLIPYPPQMDKVAAMYSDIVANGPFSEVAPEAQMKVGQAQEKRKDFHKAVQAYETAADRYYDLPDVAADALFAAGLAYHQQADKAEYDQSQAINAIETLADFIALYPDDSRTDDASSIIRELREEQAYGSYQIAKYYEKRGRWMGAKIYYNDVVELGPQTSYAEEALERIEILNRYVRPAND